MNMHILWTVCFLTLLSVSFIKCITLNKGRYEDVKVIIQDNVQENDTLIERIKEVITESSRLLFKASRNRVYFGKVDIILPKNWTTNDGYQPIPSLQAIKSYIRVENGAFVTPHTKQGQECGEAGEYIYLHPEFLLNTNRTEWGRHDNVMVHEWGHLRWGLMEEYYSDEESKFYQSPDGWQPVRCSESLSGSVGMGPDCLPDDRCDVTITSRKISSNCFFCPHPSGHNNSASIMGYQHIDEVTMFCDEHVDTVPRNQRHNADGRSAQNVFCDRRSAWEVMREHDDFKIGNNLAMPDTTDTTPVFHVLQESDAHSFVVFVLDTSGSMSTEGRIGLLYISGKQVILNKLPTNSWTGVVWFSSSASEVKQLTQITSMEVKNDIVNALPKKATGGTCIGCGILSAIKMLKKATKKLENTVIIVMSDGNDGNAKMLTEAFTQINATGVVVHTISISQAADTRMIDLAEISGGKHFMFGTAGTINLETFMSATISTGMTSLSSEEQDIASDKSPDVSDQINFSFDVERGMEQGLKVIVTSLSSYDEYITLTITGPGNFSDSMTAFEKTVTYVLPDNATRGHYNVIAASSENTTWEYSVKSKPMASDSIKVTSRVSPSRLDFSANRIPVVIANVRKAGAAVVNALVIAEVMSNNNFCKINLTDSGQDPDKVKDDGTYAGYIQRNCLGNGRVSIKVNVKGVSGKTGVMDGIRGAISVKNVVIEAKPIEDTFQRMTITENLFVSNYVEPDNDTDDTAPGRITDLDVIDIKTRHTKYGESRNFTITWTATGNDRNIGQATEYEIRIANDAKSVLKNFSSAAFLDVGNGSLVPKPSGEKEYIKISVNAEKSYTSKVYLAIVAIDEAGNQGEVSNAIPILIAKESRPIFQGRTDYQAEREQEETSTSVPETSTHQHMPAPEEKSSPIVLIVCVCLVVVVVVFTIVVVVTVYRRRTNNAKDKYNIENPGATTSTSTVVAMTGTATVNTPQDADMAPQGVSNPTYDPKTNTYTEWWEKKPEFHEKQKPAPESGKKLTE